MRRTGARSTGQVQSQRLPNLRAVIRLGTEPTAGMYTWGDVMAAAQWVTPADLAERQRRRRQNPINIRYTSGTNQLPKGATLSHHNILNNGYFVAETMRFTDRDRLVIPVPLYHCFGMVMGDLGLHHSRRRRMIYPSDIIALHAKLL